MTGPEMQVPIVNSELSLFSNMKGKKMTYFLICCVVLVWGVIFREIFLGSTENTDDPVMRHPVREPFFNRVDHALDKVSINMTHEDPFQAFSFMQEEVPMEIESKPILNNIPVKPKMNWTGISYKGQIYNKTEKRHVAIIAINGKEIMLSEGEGAEGLKFIKRTGDSIKVTYQNATTYLSIR